MEDSSDSFSKEMPVLALEEISLCEGSDRFSLEVFPGELVLFECARNKPIPDLWDVFVGLEEPMEGSVRFDGMRWMEMPEKLKEANRLCVGCVFAGSDKYESQWLDNLDIDENVVLAQSMNPAYSSRETDARLAVLMKHFDVTELPGKRPMRVSVKESMKAQWIRAFLPGELKLLILERPTYGMPTSSIERLEDRVAQVRDRGTAVLWIDVVKPESERKALAPSKHFEALPDALG